MYRLFQGNLPYFGWKFIRLIYIGMNNHTYISELNAYRDNDSRIAWSSGGSMYSTCCKLYIIRTQRRSVLEPIAKPSLTEASVPSKFLLKNALCQTQVWRFQTSGIWRRVDCFICNNFRPISFTCLDCYQDEVHYRINVSTHIPTNLMNFIS